MRITTAQGKASEVQATQVCTKACMLSRCVVSRRVLQRGKLQQQSTLMVVKKGIRKIQLYIARVSFW